MSTRLFSLLFILCGLLCAAARAETPPLLAKAFGKWSAGEGDLAFTQRTRLFNDDGTVKGERLDRYDPSLPDSQRWRLIELDGQAATDEQRKKWESCKNGKARKPVSKSLTAYLDCEHGVLVRESPQEARFELSVRPETARLPDVENIAAIVTVDKTHGTIAHIAATLREPIRVRLGLAKITDSDLDVGIDPPRENSIPPQESGVVKSDRATRVMMSKVGDPTE